MITLHDRTAAASLDRDGFAVIRLLDPASLATLREQFDREIPSPAPGFTASPAVRAPLDNLTSSRTIVDVVRGPLAAVAVGFDVIGAAFLAKGPDPSGRMEVHQDFTSVDERRGCSVNVWCPLDDVDEEGGCLEMVPGSHRWFDWLRGPSVPSVQLPFGPDVDPHLVGVPVRAGEAVVYDHRLLHGSRRNRTGSIRVAVQIGLRPVELPLVMAFAVDGSSAVELREVDEAFYLGVGEMPAASAAVHRAPAAEAWPDEATARERLSGAGDVP